MQSAVARFTQVSGREDLGPEDAGMTSHDHRLLREATLRFLSRPIKFK